MSQLQIATSAGDAAAVEDLTARHAAMAGRLDQLAERLLSAVAGRHETEAREARNDFVAWCRSDLLPWLTAEQATLHPAGSGIVAARPLVDALRLDAAPLRRLVDELAAATHPVRVAATARTVAVLFESHLAKVDGQLLPLLATAPGVSLTALARELTGSTAAGSGTADQTEPDRGGRSGEGGCGCAEVDGPEHPELDARSIPHAVRHATIFGALDSVPTGAGLVLLAPHDPLPLLAQLQERSPGRFTVSYLERGPEDWRLLFERTGS